jgi:hypothetical protein
MPLATPVEAVEGSDAKPLDLHGKFDYYLKSVTAPQPLARLALTTGLRQAMGAGDWGGGLSGYGERLSARYGELVARRTIQFGIGALRGEDPRFHRSGREGFWPRTKFVLSRTVLVDMDRGGTSIAAGKLVSAFGANALAATWHPANPNPWRQGLEGTAVSLGSDVAWRMFREFWPDIKHKFKR